MSDKESIAQDQSLTKSERTRIMDEHLTQVWKAWDETMQVFAEGSADVVGAALRRLCYASDRTYREWRTLTGNPMFLPHDRPAPIPGEAEDVAPVDTGVLP